MRIVFLSNYFNHHQKPLSDALASRCEYTFITTIPITQERLELGWGAIPEPSYVCHYDKDTERAENCLLEADVVITGSAPEKMVRQCIFRGQVVFRYSERPLKNGIEWLKYLPRLLKWHYQNPVGKTIYMLCASAYTAGDYAQFGLFWRKTFRWGYFPEVKHYTNIRSVLERKKNGSILWVGRFLDWKHPDDALRMATRLKTAGIDFQMKFIGTGEMEQQIRDLICREKLGDRVALLGAMKPEEVRRHMEESQIFLFTSDRREGWGAVLNEAMNSGCAVVASDAIGAVPFLLRDGKNGCVYHSGDMDELYNKVSMLLAEPEKIKKLGMAAYETMTENWNAEVAAERFLNLAEAALQGKNLVQMYSDGPCSPAGIIKEDWYKG